MSETDVSAPGGETPTDEEVRNAIGEGAAAGEVDGARAQRFYDRIRGRIHNYLETKGAAAGKTADVLLLVPDIFILLWRLTTDSRVSGKNKVLLGTGIAYYIFPFDFLPEALMGPMGFIDDLVFGVYVLNKVLSDTDAEVLREHWSGPGDIFDSMQKVLKAADTLVGTDLMNKIRRMVK
ncbi:MAG TPA: DUF1232 domain-containing protein [Thermoanaerobaculia bacterium]|nr:DUF1232 domain-containing protein [Thermoanaerobaculia bacterium]